MKQDLKHNNQNVLVDFNCIFDTALGSALYLKLCSTKTECFYDNIKDNNLYYFRYMAVARKEENPISYLFKPEYAGNADSIYGEMKLNKWDRVLRYSPPTVISRVLYLGARDCGYKITVNCENELEVDKIKQFTNLWKTEINISDTSPYQVLYMYDIEDIIRRKWDVDGKVVYLYDWAKNHTNYDINATDAINPLALRYINTTIFNFITPYKDFKLPVG